VQTPDTRIFGHNTQILLIRTTGCGDLSFEPEGRTATCLGNIGAVMIKASPFSALLCLVLTHSAMHVLRRSSRSSLASVYSLIPSINLVSPSSSRDKSPSRTGCRRKSGLPLTDLESRALPLELLSSESSVNAGCESFLQPWSVPIPHGNKIPKPLMGYFVEHYLRNELLLF